MTFALPEDLKRRLAGKRLIFTVTTGRSGTNYMNNMLTYLPGVKSLHEADPQFQKVLRPMQQNPELAYRFWIEEKLPAIAAYAEPIYVETSHVFCKGFLEPLLDLGIVPDLILLSRDKREVAISMYQLNHTPARSHIGRIYHVQPDDPGVLPLPGWETLHDYQLNYWYTLEIERRSRVYAEEIRRRGGIAYAVTLEDFSTVIGYWKLLLGMNLPLPGPINALKHLKSHLRRVNAKGNLKEVKQAENWDALEAEVLHRIASAQP